MSAPQGHDAASAGESPWRRASGLPARVECTWAMAGGVGAVFLLTLEVWLSGRLSSSVAVYGASIFFVGGAVFGLVHGAALGLIGHGLRCTWRGTLLSLAMGAVAAVPGLLLAWVAALFIALSTVPASLQRPLLPVAIGMGWTVGLLICAAAVVEGVRAVRNLAARVPEVREGAPLLFAAFALLVVFCLVHEPTVPGLGVTAAGGIAILLSLEVVLWIALPLLVGTIRVVHRLGVLWPPRWTF